MVIYFTKKHILLHDVTNQKHEAVALVSDGMQNLIRELYAENTWYSLDQSTTSRLISQYMKYNFLPIVFSYYNILDHLDYYKCYLYTLDGDYVGRFRSVQGMLYYMQKEIVNTNPLSFDSMRLY